MIVVSPMLNSYQLSQHTWRFLMYDNTYYVFHMYRYTLNDLIMVIIKYIYTKKSEYIFIIKHILCANFPYQACTLCIMQSACYSQWALLLKLEKVQLSVVCFVIILNKTNVFSGICLSVLAVCLPVCLCP